MRRVPRPNVKKGEVLIKIACSALCGTDLRVMFGIARDKSYNKREIILGHAWSGTVEEADASVKGLARGDKVYGLSYIPCGRCDLCKSGRENLCDNRTIPGMEMVGAHAGYAVFPAAGVRKVPRGVDLKAAALLADFLATANAAIQRAPISKGSSVILYGAGPIGLTVGTLLRNIYGVRDLALVEPAAYRRDLAKKLFAPKIYVPDGSKSFRNVFDIAYETSGSNKAFDSAIRLIRRGGDMVVVGIYDDGVSALPTTKLVTRHLRLSGTFTYTLRDLKKAEKIAANIGMEKIVTHEFPLERAAEAYSLFLKKRTGSVLLVPTEADRA